MTIEHLDSQSLPVHIKILNYSPNRNWITINTVGTSNSCSLCMGIQGNRVPGHRLDNTHTVMIIGNDSSTSKAAKWVKMPAKLCYRAI